MGRPGSIERFSGALPSGWSSAQTGTSPPEITITHPGETIIGASITTESAAAEFTYGLQFNAGSFVYQSDTNTNHATTFVAVGNP